MWQRAQDKMTAAGKWSYDYIRGTPPVTKATCLPFLRSVCEPGLWNRGMASFFGHGQGYGGQYSYDTLVNTGMHMYTTGGITGRDMLSNEGN